jgi:hypothetical protein
MAIRLFAKCNQNENASRECSTYEEKRDFGGNSGRGRKTTRERWALVGGNNLEPQH